MEQNNFKQFIKIISTYRKQIFKKSMKQSITVFLVLTIFGCSSSQKVAEEVKCPQLYQNGYKKIVYGKYETVSNNDTIKINEVRFECVFTAFYTQKVMFDKFGKWDKAIHSGNKTHPMLLWEKVDLYSNGKKYNVITNGIEDMKQIYASVMVFDENETDLLSKESPEKENLTNYFADLIKNNNNEKKDFYDVYWKMVD